MLRKFGCALLVLLALLCACAGAESVTYENGLTALYDGEHWSLVNAEGKTMLDGLTHQPYFYDNDYAVVRKGTGVMKTGFSEEDVETALAGLVNSKGELVIPCEYDDLLYQNDMNFVRAQAGDYYGLLDLEGNVVLGLGYTYISGFYNGRAVLEKNGDDWRKVYGLIDENAEFVLPMEYGYLELAEEEIIASEWTMKDGKKTVGLRGYMDRDGKWLIRPQFNDAGSFRGDYAVVGVEKKDGDYVMPMTYGVIDRKGKFVVPCEYPGISLNADGTGSILWDNGKTSFRIKGKGFEYIYTHEDGTHEVLPDWASEWRGVIPLQIEPKTYLAYWPTLGNSWSIVDADGGMLRRGALSGIREFEKGIARIERYENAERRYGYMRIGGSLVLPPIYPEANAYFYDGFATVKDESGLWGYIREDGSWLAEPRFTDADNFQNGVARVMVDELYGYIDANGEWLIEPAYDYTSGFQYGFAEVQQGKKRGIVSAAGKLVLPVKYDELSAVSDDLTVTATRDGKSVIFRLTEDGAEEVKSVASDLILEDYMPFTGKKVVKLNGEPDLEKRASDQHGHPRLDGATALFPVYSAIVETVYPEKTRYEEDYDSETLVTCTKTNKAYERLIAGDTDIIFCAGPSDAQIAAAKAKGVEFELTPFGREAFVFIVNRENPLENISVEDVRRVYSGEITNWHDLGVDGLEEIVAYQRPANSGSQTALERLMGDVPIMAAPSETISDFMDEIIETIEYRNLPNAIGYTFRFFCTEMIGSDVKLLSIDGVEPSLENIRSESYPITSTLYMVTRKGEDNPNVQALMDWVLSEQGQSLVEKAGYVGVN